MSLTVTAGFERSPRSPSSSVTPIGKQNKSSDNSSISRSLFISSNKHIQRNYFRQNVADDLYLTPSKRRHFYQEDDNDAKLKYQHLYVLPVLFMEFTALALTRAVLPALLLNEYGAHVYIVMGCADFVRGLLAFIACPMFGKISDVLGRRLCLFVTVLGTCAPVCSLALFSWKAVVVSSDIQATVIEETTHEIETTSNIQHNNNTGLQFTFESILSQPATRATTTSPYAITVFVILLSLSGIFSSTFTLIFAYISDTVRIQEERVSAYGLALATFGLSFTIGPMAGGYLAHTNPHYVFLTSFFLTMANLLYIYAVLPESRVKAFTGIASDADTASLSAANSNASVFSTNEISWNPFDSIQLVVMDPFLKQVGKVAFLYYTGLWAIISTLSVYAVKQFHLTPNRLGELMSAIGLSTMVAEAVLVRIMVPMLGEKVSMRIGLLSFAMQCIVLGFAYEPWHLFVCAAFSMLGNLVYPSLSSLVSGSVQPEGIGEALGAINGIKALTEGIGPLVFGSLMTISEHSVLPGWPYLLAAVLAIAAYKETSPLPDVETDEYIHELDTKKQRQQSWRDSRRQLKTKRVLGEHKGAAPIKGEPHFSFGSMINNIKFGKNTHPSSSQQQHSREVDEEEVEALLSEIDESWENADADDDYDDEVDSSSACIPVTIGSLSNSKRYERA